MKNHASRILRHGPLVVLTLLVFGCGNPAPDVAADSPTPRSTDVPATPAVEGTGPEHPAPAGQAPPAIQIASLPIGGRPDDRTTLHQCVKVSWVGPGIPDGASIEVTAVRIEPSGVFSLSGSGCGRPPCSASFVFAHKGDTCTVAVTAKGSPGSTAQLRLDGRLRCPQGRTTACREFAATLDEQWIDLSVPDPPMPAAASPSRSTD